MPHVHGSPGACEVASLVCCYPTGLNWPSWNPRPDASSQAASDRRRLSGRPTVQIVPRYGSSATRSRGFEGAPGPANMARRRAFWA
jgi:hypothetical protein